MALRREDLHLHFFGLPGFDPAQSYGSCLVQVPDVAALFEAFAAGCARCTESCWWRDPADDTPPRASSAADVAAAEDYLAELRES